MTGKAGPQNPFSAQIAAGGLPSIVRDGPPAYRP